MDRVKAASRLLTEISAISVGTIIFRRIAILEPFYIFVCPLFESAIHTFTITMPKATSAAFSRPHAASARPSANQGKNGESSASGAAGARNHLFNTDRFGQHILTNPLVAQGIVDKVSEWQYGMLWYPVVWKSCGLQCLGLSRSYAVRMGLYPGTGETACVV